MSNAVPPELAPSILLRLVNGYNPPMCQAYVTPPRRRLESIRVWISFLVFLLLLAEFALVGLTSSLTLSIFGILKELATIALSALLLGDALNASNLAGFAICIGGAALYNYSKRGGGGGYSGAEGGGASGEGAGSGGGEDGARGEAAHVELASNGVRSSTVA